MKKIYVDGPVTLNLDDKSHEFVKGNCYTVEDEVADHPYLKQYIVRVENVEGEEKPARKTARKTPQAKKEADDGKSDAADC